MSEKLDKALTSLVGTVDGAITMLETAAIVYVLWVWIR